MDVLTILSTLLRRWKVVAAVSVLTALALGGVVMRAEPTYEMRGSFLVAQRALGDTGVIEPGPGADGTDQQLDEDAVPAVLNPALIAEAVQDGDVVEGIRAQGGTSGYQVEVDGDLLRVVATHTDRSKVVPTVTGVLDAIEEEVAAVQADAGLPAERQAVVEPVAVPSDASVQGEVTSDQGVVYSARGAVRLAGPGVGGYNPYADTPFTVRILEEVLAGEAARARVAEAGGTGSYSIEQEEQDTAPIVYLTATGESAEEAARTFGAAREVASDELETRQAALGAPEGSRLGLFELSVPSDAEHLGSGLARPLIMLAGLGGAAAVGSALLVDNLAHGLRRRTKALFAATDAEEETASWDEDDSVSGETPVSVEDPVSEEQPAEAGEQPAEAGEPVSAEEPAEAEEPEEQERLHGHHGSAGLAAANGNGNGMARQDREAMYLAVLDRVFGEASQPKKPPLRELVPRTPTDLP